MDEVYETKVRFHDEQTWDDICRLAHLTGIRSPAKQIVALAIARLPIALAAAEALSAGQKKTSTAELIHGKAVEAGDLDAAEAYNQDA
ncbi:MAG: hypothetical protein V4529_17475 [Gemmatimonadota bacterium]